MVGDAIEIMPDGKNARIVLEPFFSQDGKRPQTLRRDGVARGAVANDRGSRSILDKLFGLADVLAEGLRGHSIDAPVGIAMTGHFVLCHGDTPHQLQIPLGHPAEHEEGGVYRGVIEQSEDLLGIVLHPALVPLPIGNADNGLKRSHLILDVQVFSP